MSLARPERAVRSASCAGRALRWRRALGRAVTVPAWSEAFSFENAVSLARQRVLDRSPTPGRFQNPNRLEPAEAVGDGLARNPGVQPLEVPPSRPWERFYVNHDPEIARIRGVRAPRERGMVVDPHGIVAAMPADLDARDVAQRLQRAQVVRRGTEREPRLLRDGHEVDSRLFLDEFVDVAAPSGESVLRPEPRKERTHVTAPWDAPCNEQGQYVRGPSDGAVRRP